MLLKIVFLCMRDGTVQLCPYNLILNLVHFQHFVVSLTGVSAKESDLLPTNMHRCAVHGGGTLAGNLRQNAVSLFLISLTLVQDGDVS